MYFWLVLLMSALFVGPSYQANLTHYEAGVVEFAPDLTALTFANRTSINLYEYLSIINSPETTGLDILVFPESTLNNIVTTTFIPEPENKIIPCYNETFEETLREISCAARDKKLYIVINLTEKSNCTEQSQLLLNDTRTCSRDGLNKYNTNVVFDRNGTVISRYRKVHLFGELQINTTLKPDVSTFETDFNVKFGHFICFDLLYPTPTLDIILQNVTDIIYPTMWFSELPFLTAVQIQQTWAYKYDVNLLAAGASYPLAGSTGSGIFAGKKGALISLMSFNNSRKLLRSSVPKINYKSEVVAVTKPYELERNDLLNLKLLVDDLTYYSSVVLNDHLNNTETTLCNNKLCCNFHVVYQLPSSGDESLRYEYRLVVFNGVRSYSGLATGGVQTCSIVACTNQTISSCGRIFSDQSMEQIIFNKITVNGFFENNDSLVLPNSLNNLLMPLDVGDYSYLEEIENSKSFISYELTRPHSDLLNFGIYGRIFWKDGWDVTNTTNTDGSASALKYHLWIYIPILCFVKFLLK